MRGEEHKGGNRQGSGRPGGKPEESEKRPGDLSGKRPGDLSTQVERDRQNNDDPSRGTWTDPRPPRAGWK
jgi:hypothetical protein